MFSLTTLRMKFVTGQSIFESDSLSTINFKMQTQFECLVSPTVVHILIQSNEWVYIKRSLPHLRK